MRALISRAVMRDTEDDDSKLFITSWPRLNLLNQRNNPATDTGKDKAWNKYTTIRKHSMCHNPHSYLWQDFRNILFEQFKQFICIT